MSSKGRGVYSLEKSLCVRDGKEDHTKPFQSWRSENLSRVSLDKMVSPKFEKSGRHIHTKFIKRESKKIFLRKIQLGPNSYKHTTTKKFGVTRH